MKYICTYNISGYKERKVRRNRHAKEPAEGKGAALVNISLRLGLIKRETFKQRLEEDEKMNHTDMLLENL